jgi:hypothetical protein
MRLKCAFRRKKDLRRGAEGLLIVFRRAFLILSVKLEFGYNTSQILGDYRLLTGHI